MMTRESSGVMSQFWASLMIKFNDVNHGQPMGKAKAMAYL
jgi:hypothetical protein